MLETISQQPTIKIAESLRGQDQQANSVTPNSVHEEQATASNRVRTLPGQDETGPDGRKKDTFELSREAEEIRKLQARDREVRAHEAAHVAVGGAYAGSASYTYERGPDGQSYAVGGEVSISVSAISGDPQATLQKAQQVRAAALAPAEPSGQDMRVAQRAQALAAKARMQLAEEQTAALKQGTAGSVKPADETEQPAVPSDRTTGSESPSDISINPAGTVRLTTYA